MSLPPASAAKADSAAPAKPDDLKGRLKQDKLKFDFGLPLFRRPFCCANLCIITHKIAFLYLVCMTGAPNNTGRLKPLRSVVMSRPSLFLPLFFDYLWCDLVFTRYGYFACDIDNDCRCINYFGLCRVDYGRHQQTVHRFRPDVGLYRYSYLSAHELLDLPLAVAGHRHGRIGLPAVALAQRYDS